MPNYRKYANKVAKKSKIAVKKRYMKKGKANPAKMWKDIMMLKSIVNSEKKQYNLSDGGSLLGQVNGNAEGAYTIDVTPNPAQGIGDSNRIGDSIKLSTGMFKFQFSHMSATASPIRVVVELVLVLGTPQATSTFLNQYLLPNTFIPGVNIRDTNSHRDQDFRTQYRTVAKRSFIMKGDQSSGQKQCKSLDLPLKFGNLGHHIKYVENTTHVACGQLMLLIRCDNGNLSTTTNSTLANLIHTGQSTGLSLNRSFTYYYYDN